MTFKHPLARDAKVWATAGSKGKAQNILVVITTLELDKDQKKFKADKHKQLADAAKEWIGENPTLATDYMLVNRPKDWNGKSD